MLDYCKTPRTLGALLTVAVLTLCNHAAFGVDQAAIKARADTIITHYRQMIVLFLDEETLSAVERDYGFTIGQVIYHNNLDLLNELTIHFETELLAEDAPIVEKFLTEDFLDLLETNTAWWDVDKLAFRGLLDDVLLTLDTQENLATPIMRIKVRIQDDLQVLEGIQARYNREISDIFARFEARALQPRREAWEDYAAFLHTQFTRQAIFAEHDPDGLLAPTSRGVDNSKDPESQELFGASLPEKTLALTFDDGPHPRYTTKILDILQKYQVKAVFFQIGQQVGEFQDDGEIRFTKASQVNAQIIEHQSTLANHTYTHSALPKLQDDGVIDELQKTNTLLRLVAGSDPILFRPPYGASNANVLAQVQAQNLQSVMWNIDSKDWADPVPKSIANRVLKLAAQEKRGIMLFHDIQPQTIDALPLILEALQTEGYQFAAWDGEQFAVEGQVIAPEPLALYHDNWAVIIGIDDYVHWPKLKYAVNDAKGVQALLIEKFAFQPDHVLILLNAEATQKNILTLLNDTLVNPKLLHKDDRVLIFYAGHGATRKLPSGRELGYIIPVDAPAAGYYGQSISMTHFSDISEALVAKHVLFVMDSCYSGLGLVRGGGSSDILNYIQDASQRVARQMLTAGGADQQVADSGPNGHSIFTWTLLQSLEGKGDLNQDGYITASELAAHLAPVVSSISAQTPAFGNLVGSEGGDVIFRLNHQPEFLSELSEQLDDQALTLNAQIERLRDEISQKRDRNLQLKKELSAVRQQIEQAERADSNASSGEPALTPRQLNDQGLTFYQEKKYAEAAQHFVAAANLDPTYTEAVNNAGFIYYKLEQYEDAAIWLQKAIALDPGRSVAWLNLGDAFFHLRQYPKAREAYEHYLTLNPDPKVAERIKAQLQSMQSQTP